MPSIYDSRAVERFFRQSKFDPYHLRRFRYSWLRMFQGAERALRYLPESHHAPFCRAFELESLRLVSQSDSATDGATKLVFHTPQQLPLETVLLRSATGRTSLCVSSQSGCAVNCSFCATATLARTKNLQAEEILEQVVRAAQLVMRQGGRLRNVVFMGMGEPLQNEREVGEAIEDLVHPDLFSISPGRLIVSTVGIPDAMVRFVERFPKIRLAVSLHSADQSLRERLIPLAKKVTLKDLRCSLETVLAVSRWPVMVEYLMLYEQNDSLEEARQLAEYLRGLFVHINLIPFNAVAHQPQLQPTPRRRREAFARYLRDQGFVTTIRYSQGSDIEAACGQLAANSQ